MKRLFPISILIVLMFNISGVFFVFKIQQNRIRREIKQQIKAGIPEEKLHIFKLSKAEYEQLDWVRPDIEFRKGNEMFDIVRSEKHGNTIQLYCVNDKEEAVLFVELDEMVKKKTEQDSNSSNCPANKMIKMLQLLQFVQDIDYSLRVSFTINKNSFSDISFCYTSPFIDKETPPPDSV